MSVTNICRLHDIHGLNPVVLGGDILHTVEFEGISVRNDRMKSSGSASIGTEEKGTEVRVGSGGVLIVAPMSHL